ncbi:hypothetical protein RRG08_063267 [Elysia crispata]|uniref:Uncharacterized protein n=1 Tax=Elysia crispata TaxID=231223 RepID=A0AAE1CJX3_9GAST|nr:hypothetical protein RRG08_063267 [Elysia crispata]
MTLLGVCAVLRGKDWGDASLLQILAQRSMDEQTTRSGSTSSDGSGSTAMAAVTVDKVMAAVWGFSDMDQTIL